MAKVSCDTGKVDIEALKNAVRALESPRAKRERERVAVFSALYHDIRDQVSMGVSKSLILKTLIEHGISISNAVFDELLADEAERRGESVAGRDDEVDEDMSRALHVAQNALQAAVKDAVIA